MTRARDVADTQDNVGGAVPPVVAGKNAVINGAFDIWQRGTSFVPSTTAFGPDRWQVYRNTTGCTASRQTPGSTLPQFQYCARMQRDSGNSAINSASYAMTLETSESLKYAGQTVTLSFYARAGANFSGSSASLMRIYLAHGTGTDQNVISGFTGVTYVVNGTTNGLLSITTSWVRYSFTVSIPSTATQLGLELNALFSGTAGAADYFEVTGVQLEIGSVATPFSRAGGTIQGELAACQRYYYRFGGTAYMSFGWGTCYSTTQVQGSFFLPVTMRTNPTTLDYSLLNVFDGNNITAVTAAVFDQVSPNAIRLGLTVGSAVLTVYRPYNVIGQNSTSTYIGVSAEL